MDRQACLELPALPLQLVLRAHADWRGEPAAVIERDAPHGLVVCANESARAAGVLPGQRYAAALGLCGRLRADVITAEETQRAVAGIVERLQHFSPLVEPFADELGTFWIGARGMQRMFGTPREWATTILADVRASGLAGRIAVGFRHFPVYAAVKALERSPIAVFDDPAHEARVAGSLSLARLSIDPSARDALKKLGVITVRQLASLPAGGILQRFGADVHRIHRLAAGAFDEELAPVRERIPLATHVDLDMPEESIDAILAYTESLARPMCEKLVHSAEATTSITLSLDLDDRRRIEECVVPARPTCDVDWLMRLLRMRLDGRRFTRGIVRIEVTLERVPVRPEQASLYVHARSRSVRAAAKAFSALRATYGEDSVVYARLTSAHLPEHSFAWERCDDLPPPAPRSVLRPPLVRRMFEVPQALPPRGRREPDGWLLRGVTHGSVEKLRGPFRVSGGWWRAEVRREYYFAELTDGEIAWIYYDVHRRRWFLQGTVA